jgi:hypothetical protein
LKAGIASLVVAALASGGLTLNGADTLGPGCDAFVEKVSLKLHSHAASVAARVAGLAAHEPSEHQPGPTYVLVVLDEAVVGLDPDGYVTSVDKAFAGSGFPAMTGLFVEGFLEGRRLSQPEITTGLSVTKAFERHKDLFKMLSEVNVSNLEQPRVILKGGTIVEIGTGDYAMKIDRLHQVLLQVPHLDMFPRRVDLRFNRQVVIEYSQVRNRARKEV